MNGPTTSTDTTGTALGPVAVTRPAGAAYARLRLDPRVRAKFETIETEAEDALAIVRLGSDRLNEARRALVDVQQRITFATADRYRPPVGLPDLEAERMDAEQRVARLVRDHEAAQARWTVASQLRTACAAYLGL
jgi:hypothetical protein